jgi:hypothetical protein
MQGEQLAVGAAVDVRLGDCRSTVGAWRGAGGEQVGEWLDAEVGHGLDHRHLDAAPHTAALALI